MKKILVIEDEPEMRRNHLTILSLEKFQPIGAENGSVGLALARSQKPDLVICGVMMPAMDGYAVLLSGFEDGGVRVALALSQQELAYSWSPDVDIGILIELVERPRSSVGRREREGEFAFLGHEPGFLLLVEGKARLFVADDTHALASSTALHRLAIRHELEYDVTAPVMDLALSRPENANRIRVFHYQVHVPTRTGGLDIFRDIRVAQRWNAWESRHTPRWPAEG